MKITKKGKAWIGGIATATVAASVAAPLIVLVTNNQKDNSLSIEKEKARKQIDNLFSDSDNTAYKEYNEFKSIKNSQKEAFDKIKNAKNIDEIQIIINLNDNESLISKISNKIEIFNKFKDKIIKNQNKIDSVITTKPLPTIKPGSETKTASQISTEDFVAPSVDDLTFKITAATKSTQNDDGTTATVTIEVSSAVVGTEAKTYNVEVSGFISKAQVAQAAQNKIDNVITTKPLPTIKPGSETKTASQISTDDFVAPSVDDLTFKITAATKSTQNDDGTTATVTIEVSSAVVGTEAKTYNVEVSGFISKAQVAQAAQNKIDNVITTKPLPTIKPGSETKTASQISTDDFVAPSVDDLTFKITAATKSTQNDDGTTATVTIEVSSAVVGTEAKTYNVEVSGFISKAQVAQAAQNKIDNVITTKPLPTIKPGSETKTASQISTDDFVAPSVDDLTFKITAATKSTQNDDGTTATVTIEVSSAVVGTEAKTYNVEVSAFKTEAFFKNSQDKIFVVENKGNWWITDWNFDNDNKIIHVHREHAPELRKKNTISFKVLSNISEFGTYKINVQVMQKKSLYDFLPASRESMKEAIKNKENFNSIQSFEMILNDDTIDKNKSQKIYSQDNYDLSFVWVKNLETNAWEIWTHFDISRYSGSQYKDFLALIKGYDEQNDFIHL